MELESQFTNECDVNPLFEGNIIPESILKYLKDYTTPDDALCQSCGKIFWNPLTCSDIKCAATYCELCLRQHFKKEEICP